MPICPATGVTLPECSCLRCLSEQVRRFWVAAPGDEATAEAGTLQTQRPRPPGASPAPRPA